MNRTLAACFICMMMSLGSATTPAARAVVMPRYQALPVGSVPAGASILAPSDINDVGTIVGSVALNSDLRGFRLRSGQLEILEPLSDGSYSYATAVNNANEVAGSSDESLIPKGAYWAPGSTAPLELPTSGGPDANVYPTDINSIGQISGFFTGSGSGNVNSWTAIRWYWDEDRFRNDELNGPVPPPPGVPTMANDINDLGQIVGLGSTQQAGVFQGGLRWTGANQVEELTAPQGLFFARIEGVAITNSQVTVGQVTDTFGNSEALLWGANLAVTELRKPVGSTTVTVADVNEQEMIVGSGVFGGTDRGVANFQQQWVDLNSRLINSAGWRLNTAAAINELGQIVGVGSYNGVATGFVLNPVAELGPGDFDLDGDVDGADFLFWQRGGSPDPLSFADLAEWQSIYGAGASTGAVATVPEPRAIMLAVVAGIAVAPRKLRLYSASAGICVTPGRGRTKSCTPCRKICSTSRFGCGFEKK